MEENIYDFLGLTPKDGEAKVKEELEAQIKKWTNQFVHNLNFPTNVVNIITTDKPKEDVLPGTIRQNFHRCRRL